MLMENTLAVLVQARAVVRIISGHGYGASDWTLIVIMRMGSKSLYDAVA